MDIKILFDKNLKEVKEIKNNLLPNEGILCIANESYIATLSEETEGYLNFNNEIPVNFFRDCYLEKDNSVLLSLHIKKGIMTKARDLAISLSNVWYAVLADFLPLERLGTKIRTLDGLCVADFVADVSKEAEDIIIGYINIGTTFDQPEIESLIKNRDCKGVCNLPQESFEEILLKVKEKIIETMEDYYEIF